MLLALAEVLVVQLHLVLALPVVVLEAQFLSLQDRGTLVLLLEAMLA